MLESVLGEVRRDAEVGRVVRRGKGNGKGKGKDVEVC